MALPRSMTIHIHILLRGGLFWSMYSLDVMPKARKFPFEKKFIPFCQATRTGWNKHPASWQTLYVIGVAVLFALVEGRRESLARRVVCNTTVEGRLPWKTVLQRCASTLVEELCRDLSSGWMKSTIPCKFGGMGVIRKVKMYTFALVSRINTLVEWVQFQQVTLLWMNNVLVKNNSGWQHFDGCEIRGWQSCEGETPPRNFWGEGLALSRGWVPNAFVPSKKIQIFSFLYFPSEVQTKKTACSTNISEQVTEKLLLG